MIPLTLEPLRQFRQQVYQSFNPARDAAFEIMDAISASPVARSAVEVSLASGMQRRFSSVYKGLERVRIDTSALRQVLVRLSEREECFQVAGYAVYVLDHTPYPRRPAPTVSDRGFVRGAAGEVVGHQYSLPGRVMHPRGNRVGLSDCERIASSITPVQVAAQQVARLKSLRTGPFVVTADSEYFVAELLDQAAPGCCLLARLKANRVLYDAPPPPTGKRGRPRRHGPRLQLNRPATLRPPDRFYPLEQPDGGRVELALWQNVHERTHPDLALCAIRVEQFRPDGQRRFPRSLWLGWTGPWDMDWPTFWQVYLRRFAQERVHQFAKNSLAWTRARLGYTGREERWTWLVLLACWQLLLAAPVARDLPRPWEKPTAPQDCPSPARVQRDIGRILALVGTPVRPPKPRGNPCGRPVGYHPAPRPRYAVIRKSVRAP